MPKIKSQYQTKNYAKAHSELDKERIDNQQILKLVMVIIRCDFSKSIFKTSKFKSLLMIVKQKAN